MQLESCWGQAAGVVAPGDLGVGSWRKGEKRGGTIPFSSEIQKHICGCHNFFPLSSVQIIIIPACCLLCVL